MKKLLATLFAALLIMVAAPASIAHESYENGPLLQRNCNICHGSGSCTPTGCAGPTYCTNGHCGFCYGSGKVSVQGTMTKCTSCDGTGKCRRCNGTGKCPKCHGAGFGGSISHSSSSGGSGDSSDDGASADGEYDNNLITMLSEASPVLVPVMIGAAALLSYGVFGYAAIHNWNVPSAMYPSMELRAGYSYIYGEDVSARAVFGGKGGVIVSAGMGINLFNKAQTLYHMGAGFYISPGRANNISWTWELGHVLNREEIVGSTIAEYTHYFGSSLRHGVFAGAGVGYGYDEIWMPEFRLGYSYRFYDMHDDYSYPYGSGIFFSVGLGVHPLADITVGYKLDEHWSFGASIGMQTSIWDFNSSIHSGDTDIETPVFPGLRASYRLNDNTWSPFASVQAGIAPAKEFDANTKGALFYITPELGVSQRFNYNNYMEYSLGAIFNGITGFSDLSPHGRKILPAIHVRYVRVLTL